MKKDYFFCKRKIFKGNWNDTPILRITYFLIFAFTILFIFFDGVHLCNNDDIIFLFVYFILFLGTMYNLLSTQFKDPGIILKNYKENDIELTSENAGNF